ncbi:hypothetical protein [Arthrobacter sp. 35W]|uniref:hypothetical protein n=1 Tax=Arthrobacter sp. 35W TaxID=1132441 RepID=UPI000413D67D|nr:hypothetical protein [Arthrobacter sp. 35W]
MAHSATPSPTVSLRPGAAAVRSAAPGSTLASTPAAMLAATPAPVPAAVRVLPIVDALLGTVEFRCAGVWLRLWCADPAGLGAALDRAVAPPRWHPQGGTITVAVAATGRRTGVELHFPLHPDHR